MLELTETGFVDVGENKELVEEAYKQAVEAVIMKGRQASDKPGMSDTDALTLGLRELTTEGNAIASSTGQTKLDPTVRGMAHFIASVLVGGALVRNEKMPLAFIAEVGETFFNYLVGYTDLYLRMQASKEDQGGGSD